jgi:uncharacterized protein (DUF433 family)
MATQVEYINTNEHGVMRIQDTRVTLDSVVYAFLEGLSPEGIRARFPVLTLEQVYGAITYYLAHRDEVESYLKRQQDLWERLRAEIEANPSPVVERLRAQMRNEAAGKK